MSWFRSRGPLDRAFEIGIIAKGLDGLAEVVGGLVLLAVSPAAINHFIVRVTQHELSEDPRDLIATRLLHAGEGLTGATVGIAAAYLLAHGMVKVVLVAALLRNQLWAYPVMMTFLIVFIGYQVYRIAVAPAIWLVGLTIFDSFVLWLTWREWRRQRGRTRLARDVSA